MNCSDGSPQSSAKRNMEKNTHTPSSGDKPEKKTPQQGGNLVWYMLGLGVLLLLVVTMLGNTHEQNLSWSDLLQLVDARGPGGRGYIDVTDSSGTPLQRWRISDLQKVEIGGTSVTAKITRRKLAPVSSSPEATGDARYQPVGDMEKDIALRVNRDPEEQRLEARLEKNGVEYSIKGQPSALLSYVPLLLMTALLVLLFIFMIRRMGGAGSPMAFGRSRGKLYAQEDIDITFEDVAGIDEAVEELREVVEFLKTPEKYQMLGGRIPKGVLLVGPPGTGKTLLAKAVAGEAGVPFFSLSGSDFVEMFVGVGAARVRDMFQQAEQKAPCIIFIDELDALGKTRGSGIIGGHDEREQTLNALLVEMDGFGSNSGVIVMAATNRPETLDAALLRPGRFDRHVLVDRPDVGGREEILEVHVQNVKLDADVDVRAAGRNHQWVCRCGPGQHGERSGIAGGPQGPKSRSRMADFNEAVERSSAGLEKKSRIMHEEEKLRVAYHESGPRARGLLAAQYRPGPQGFDHSAWAGGAGLHDAAARAGPLPDDAKRAGKPHPGAAWPARWPRKSSSATFPAARRTTWSGPPKLPAAW